jgi:hypothetical protein
MWEGVAGCAKHRRSLSGAACDSETGMSGMRRSSVRKVGFPVLAGLLLLGGAGAQALGCGGDSGSQAQGSAGTGGGASSSAAGSSGAQGSGGGGEAPCSPSYACDIEVLSEETDKAYGDISLSPSRVFWVRDSGFSYRDKDLLNPSREDRVSLLNVQHVAAESDKAVYFTTPQSVVHYDVSNELVTELMQNIDPTGLTVHMGFAYWPSQLDNMIYKGRPDDVMATNNVAGSSPSLIASSDGTDQVYWTYHGLMPDMNTGGVKKLNAGDVVGAPPQNRPTGIAADGEDVYWITGEGAIHKHEGATQVVTNASPPVANLQVSSGRIAVSAEHVYWLGPDAASCSSGCDCGSDCGAVWRVPKSDIKQAPETFAKMNWSVLKGLAVDATHVYWTTGGADSKLLRKAH